MNSLWLLHLLLCTTLYNLELSVCTPIDDPDGTELKFEDELYPDNIFGVVPSKRLSKFVRIGRGLSSFIRIGRGQPKIYGFDSDVIDDVSNLGDSTYDEDDNSAFETPDFQLPKRRLSSFVRIGRNGDFSEPEDMDDGFQKRGGAFIRMGKFPSSALLRHRGGMIQSIARQPYYRRSGRIGQSSFIRIGKRDTTDALERMAEQHVRNPTEEYRRYLRIGKDLDGKEQGLDDTFKNPEDKRLSSFVRIGRGPAVRGDDLYKHYMNFDGIPDKRMSKFVRIGKDGPEAEKRFSKFVRIGKGNQENDDFMNKRFSKFVRIGKGGQQGDDFMDKRFSKFVRIGKGGQQGDDFMDKRFSKFVRIGKDNQQSDDLMDKRFSKFVRIGKDLENLDSSLEKRLSSFVRIGKSDGTDLDNKDKRLSSFVRIGKNAEGAMDSFTEPDGLNKDLDNLETANDGEEESKVVDKRALSRFVRIGKSGIENNPGNFADLTNMDKRRLSSFVRIGRSTENMDTASETDSKESNQ